MIGLAFFDCPRWGKIAGSQRWTVRNIAAVFTVAAVILHDRGMFTGAGMATNLACLRLSVFALLLFLPALRIVQLPDHHQPDLPRLKSRGNFSALKYSPNL